MTNNSRGRRRVVTLLHCIIVLSGLVGGTVTVCLSVCSACGHMKANTPVVNIVDEGVAHYSILLVYYTCTEYSAHVHVHCMG